MNNIMRKHLVLLVATVTTIGSFTAAEIVDGVIWTNTVTKGYACIGEGSVSRREIPLDEGTRIAEEGGGLRAVGGFRTYNENMGGNFSRTS